MKLPVQYHSIPRGERWKVREEYIKIQNGLCAHCEYPLNQEAAPEILCKDIDSFLFPDGFFENKKHLHHDHKTGFTIGVVHAECNAVLWQYHGE